LGGLLPTSASFCGVCLKILETVLWTDHRFRGHFASFIAALWPFWEGNKAPFWGTILWWLATIAGVQTGLRSIFEFALTKAAVEPIEVEQGIDLPLARLVKVALPKIHDEGLFDTFCRLMPLYCNSIPAFREALVREVNLVFKPVASGRELAHMSNVFIFGLAIAETQDDLENLAAIPIAVATERDQRAFDAIRVAWARLGKPTWIARVFRDACGSRIAVEKLQGMLNEYLDLGVRDQLFDEFLGELGKNFAEGCGQPEANELSERIIGYYMELCKRPELVEVVRNAVRAGLSAEQLELLRRWYVGQAELLCPIGE
jgi:hypothetical protein